MNEWWWWWWWWDGTPEAKQWDVLRNGWDGGSEGQSANLQVGQTGWPLLGAAARVCANTGGHVAIKRVCVPRLCDIVTRRHLSGNTQRLFWLEKIWKKLLMFLESNYIFNAKSILPLLKFSVCVWKGQHVRNSIKVGKPAESSVNLRLNVASVLVAPVKANINILETVRFLFIIRSRLVKMFPVVSGFSMWVWGTTDRKHHTCKLRWHSLVTPGCDGHDESEEKDGAHDGPDDDVGTGDT